MKQCRQVLRTVSTTNTQDIHTFLRIQCHLQVISYLSLFIALQTCCCFKTKGYLNNIGNSLMTKWFINGFSYFNLKKMHNFWSSFIIYPSYECRLLSSRLLCLLEQCWGVEENMKSDEAQTMLYEVPQLEIWKYNRFVWCVFQWGGSLIN